MDPFTFERPPRHDSFKRWLGAHPLMTSLANRALGQPPGAGLLPPDCKLKME